jgi:hypothetical protein
MRVQSGIARASQRDSEDMKFIAVLGSIFLPAGLVAVSLLSLFSVSMLTASKSVLNVPGWQFLPAPELFGVYIAITIPLIALVVFICFSRPYWKRLAPKIFRSEKKKPLARAPSILRKMETFRSEL